MCCGDVREFDVDRRFVGESGVYGRRSCVGGQAEAVFLEAYAGENG